MTEMTEASERELMRRAIDAWGEETQVLIAMEECGELTSALSRLYRGRPAEKDVIEEIADMKIMVEQLSIIFGEITVEQEVERKLERLEERLND